MTLDARQDTLLRLNLGCGSNKLDGFINVDKYGDPDVRCDLEQFPWPWPDNSIGAVVMSHVLEHLGADPDVFIGIMKELYRVCAPGARIEIAVPHWRHDNFTGDPTHVRVINAQVMSLFDAEQCRAWQAGGYSNTPLALYHGVDFKLVAHQKVPAWRYEKMPAQNLEQMERDANNVIVEIRMALEVRKDPLKQAIAITEKRLAEDLAAQPAPFSAAVVPPGRTVTVSLLIEILKFTLEQHGDLPVVLRENDENEPAACIAAGVMGKGQAWADYSVLSKARVHPQISNEPALVLVSQDEFLRDLTLPAEVQS